MNQLYFSLLTASGTAAQSPIRTGLFVLGAIVIAVLYVFIERKIKQHRKKK